MGALTLRLEVYDAEARRHILAAQTLAEGRDHRVVQPLHLLYRLADQSPSAQATFTAANLDPLDVLVEAESSLRKLPKSRDGELPYMSASMLELLGRAEGEASREHADVDARHLLLALAQEGRGSVREVMRQCGLSAPVIRSALGSLEGETRTAESSSSRVTSSSGTSELPATRNKEEFPEGLVDYAEDWTALSTLERFDPTVGRDEELRRILQVLARRRENNPLLVGEAGIGKRAIIQALASRMADGDVPGLLKDKHLFSLDLAALVAGARLRGQLEERIRGLLSAVRDAAGNVLLYLPDLERLAGESRSGAASLFSAALSRGELQAIATATPEAYKKALNEQPSLVNRFVPIEVEPPSEEEAIAVMRGVVDRYERAHGLKISDPALIAAVMLGRRYIPTVHLPKCAIDLIDEAAARVRVELHSVPAQLDTLERRLHSIKLQLGSLADDRDADSRKTAAALEQERGDVQRQAELLRKSWEAEKAALMDVESARRELAAAISTGDGPTDDLEAELTQAETALRGVAKERMRDAVRPEDVADVVATWTGIPVSKMMEEEASKLLRMEDRLKARVIGQQAAVTAVSKAVRRGRVGLRDPRKPIGSFLFLGPTGVGKTELAKALAEFLFDDEHSLTRLDMSEFMEKHMVARLLGSPPGYVDSDEGGYLTEAVRRRPYSVVLFDEMEKAHPDVFNILLQVLDDGRLTDSRGQLAVFSETVIIMTSNVGGHAILQASEEGDATQESLQEIVQHQLREFFRPEFLNRIDDVVIFNRLDKDDLRGIVDIQLRQLANLMEFRDLKLEVSSEARNQLVELGYDPAFGARPLKRVILKNLQDPLAEEILRGGYQAGDMVSIGFDGTAFQFTHQRG